MKYLLMIIMLFLSSTSFALFCPANFSQINIGDTIDQVIKTCGNPSSNSSHQKITVLSEQWTYYVKTNFNSFATSKMIIIFSNNKVINISIETNNSINSNVYQVGNQPVLNVAYNNNQASSVASTSACGSPISIGDGPQKVANICGKPAFIKQNKSPLTENTPIEITELKYSGITPTTLVFENGVLKERIT
jgi:hypothetical protein